ncbi:MAG: hypothetical protein IJR61_00660 [Clostridia bacterium]|nr:hypothetical protein [Clostridia bacterium]
MKTMTSKERIDAVLAHKPVDRIPFCLVDGGAWIAQTENITYRTMYGTEDGGAAKIVKWTDELETDIVSAVSGVFTAPLNAFGCPIHIDSVGQPVNAGIALHNPEEEIPKLDHGTIREKLLANEFVQNMLKQCRNVKKLVGDRKYLIGDIAAPFTMAAVMVGTQDFIMLMLDEPELVKRLIDFTTHVSAEVFRLLHENGCDIAFPADPVASGNLISPGMYEEWALPALKNLKNMLPEYKYFFAHICGASGERVGALRDAGVHAFSCDWTVDLDSALENAEGKMVIFGNINPAGSLLTGKPEEVYAEACERIKVAAGRPYILATGCDMGSATPLENVKMLLKACKDCV